jgi:hypothetical protein
MGQIAVMTVDKGEELIYALISGHIPGTGYYKFLAKKNKKGIFEWVHFKERDNGLKEGVYRGETKTKEELKIVLEIMNRNLKKIFGDKAEMKEAMPEFRSVLGTKFDDTVN